MARPTMVGENRPHIASEIKLGRLSAGKGVDSDHGENAERYQPVFEHAVLSRSESRWPPNKFGGRQGNRLTYCRQAAARRQRQQFQRVAENPLESRAVRGG